MKLIRLLFMSLTIVATPVLAEDGVPTRLPEFVEYLNATPLLPFMENICGGASAMKAAWCLEDVSYIRSTRSDVFWMRQRLGHLWPFSSTAKTLAEAYFIKLVELQGNIHRWSKHYASLPLR
jgi:hypothetical protein